MDVAFGGGQKAEAFLLNELEHRARRSKKQNVVAMKVPQRCGELDTVKRSTTNYEVVAEYEDLHDLGRIFRLKVGSGCWALRINGLGDGSAITVSVRRRSQIAQATSGLGLESAQTEQA